MKKRVTSIAALVVAASVVGMVSVLTGCQSPGSKPAMAGSAVCPLCDSETTSMEVEDMKFEKNVCPGCKTVSTIDPSAPASMQDYIDPLERSVHVCDHCDAMVSTCAGCRG